VYQTPPGLAIVGVRCALVLWAARCLWRTFTQESELPKRQFYLVWAIIALAWIGSLPVIVGIAVALPSYMRQRIVFAIVNTVQALLYLSLTYLFRPFRSNRYVSILNANESRAFGGESNMQVFPMATNAQGQIIQFANI